MENHHFKWINQLFLWPFSSSQTVSLPEGNSLTWIHGYHTAMGYGITANACEPGMRLAIFHSDIRTWEEMAQFLGFYPSIDTPSTSCLIRAKPYWRTNFLTDLQKQKNKLAWPKYRYILLYVISPFNIPINCYTAIVCYHMLSLYLWMHPQYVQIFSVIDSENHQYCG